MFRAAPYSRAFPSPQRFMPAVISKSGGMVVGLAGASSGGAALPGGPVDLAGFLAKYCLLNRFGGGVLSRAGAVLISTLSSSIPSLTVLKYGSLIPLPKPEAPSAFEEAKPDEDSGFGPVKPEALSSFPPPKPEAPSAFEEANGVGTMRWSLDNTMRYSFGLPLPFGLLTETRPCSSSQLTAERAVRSEQPVLPPSTFI
jgi:hypothetical protein